MTAQPEEKLELQFDRAEPSRADAGGPATATGRVECSACGARLLSYYSVGGKVACRRCRDAAVAARGGSHLPTLLAAAGLGLAAAAAGAIVYFAVARITGYEIGLVSIVVGLLVGKAVRMGARARGGWRYQALAVFLCYLSIASSYFALVVAELRDSKANAPAAVQPGPQAATGDAAPAGAGAGEEPAPAQAAGTAAPAAEGEAPADGEAPQGLLAYLGGLVAFVLKLPFLIGSDSPMTFVLVGIALWEAWKLNVETPFEASGPYAVGGEPVANG